MDTNFIIILSPEKGPTTEEYFLIVSKLPTEPGGEMEVLGALKGDHAKELVDLFLGMKDKEENESCKGCARETGCYTKFPCKECTRIHDDEYGKRDYFVEEDKNND